MRIEVWKSEDGLWHWLLREDDGTVASTQNFYRRRIDCNLAIARCRTYRPDAEIVVLQEPPK